MPAGTELAERMWFLPDPVLLAPASRAFLGKKMELYAGMVENLDFHVGRLVDHLKEIGEYENTVFIVFGDNGAEGTDLFKMIAGTPGTRDFLFAAVKWSQTHPNAWGDPGSYVGLRPDVGAGVDDALQPVQGMARRGRYPECADRQRPGRQGPGRERQPRPHARGGHHADAARAGRRQLPDDARGTRAAGPSGQVLGSDAGGRGRVGAGVAGRPRMGGLRQPRAAAGDWKLRWQVRPFGKGEWELFNLAADPAERKDLAAERPDKVTELTALWDDYVRANNVILPSRTPFETMEKQMPQRVPDDPGFPPLTGKKQFVPPPDMVADPEK